MKYIYIIILFIFFSCGDMENVIDLEIPPHEPVLVLNGIFSTDDTASVTISHSVGAFDLTVPAYLPNAEVLLYKDNVLIGEMQLDFTDMISVGYIDVNDNTGASHFNSTSRIIFKNLIADFLFKLFSSSQYNASFLISK